MDHPQTIRDLPGIHLPILTAQLPRDPVLRLFEKHEDLQALPVRLQRSGEVWRMTRRMFLQLCATDRSHSLRPTMKHLEPAWVLDAHTSLMDILTLDPAPEFPIFCRDLNEHHLQHISMATFFPALHALLRAGSATDKPSQAEQPVVATGLEAELVGTSASIRSVREMVIRLARNDLPAFISGPPGSGKTLVAKSIHHLSGNAAAACRLVHADKLDEGTTHELLHLLQQADGDPVGTLILKNVEHLPRILQRQLLTLLEQGSASQASACRILALSQKKPEEFADAVEFDNDVLQRLGVVHLALPPLDQRRQDIPLLVRLFCQKFGGMVERTIRVDALALRWLQHQTFSKNVRQLEEMVQRFSIESDRLELDRQALRALGMDAQTGNDVEPLALSPNILKETVAQAEREALSKVLASTRGNLSAAARFLKLDRAGLHRKLKRLGLRVVA